MIVASQNVLHTQGKEIRKRADDFESGHTRVGAGHLHGRAICRRAQQLLEGRFPA